MRKEEEAERRERGRDGRGSGVGKWGGAVTVSSNARHPRLAVIKPLSKSTVQKVLCPPKRAFNF